MTIGGIIAIFIAMWIYRTALEAKTGNAIYWVIASFVTYLILQILMIKFNATIIEIFDGDVSAEYDSAGGLNARDNSDTAGLQSGTGGSFIGVIFELITWVLPFLAIAIIRLKLMLKQPFSFGALFGGLSEMFTAIANSFKSKEEEKQSK